MGSLAQVGVLKGHGFSRAANGTKRTRALAPEGCFSVISSALLRLSKKYSMKISNCIFSSFLIVGFCLSDDFSMHASGQTSQNSPASPSPTVQSVQAGPIMQDNHEWHKCLQCGPSTRNRLIAKLNRYLQFFAELKSWDDLAKRRADTGDTGQAEFWRTILEKRSELNTSEAIQVKQIAFQCLQDSQVLNKMIQNRIVQSDLSGSQEGSSNVPAMTRKELENERVNLVKKAKDQLTSTLSSEAFNKLDSFVRNRGAWPVTTQGPVQQKEEIPRQ